jgi:hypothetical protein
VLALVALVPATVVWLRERQRSLGRRLGPADVAGRTAWTGAILLLIVIGWR